MIKWHVSKKKIGELTPTEKNPRIITKTGIDMMINSIDDIGLAQPINIDLDGTILSGHARYFALMEKYDAEYIAPVLIPDHKLNQKERRAVIVRMNKNIAGQWDHDILANDYDIDELLEYGFTPDELTGPQQLEPEAPKETEKKDEKEICPVCGK